MRSMTSADDPTKALLEKLVVDLYSAASSNPQSTLGSKKGSYLEAADKQYLGKITEDTYDTESIINQYGPYGSAYSATSIFNHYCPYGGQFGRFSPENPYTTTPPKLFINGSEIGRVSANSFIQNRIPADAFMHSLRNDIPGLLLQNVSRSDKPVWASVGGTFIQAGDGTFLGSLNPNKFDIQSIFNRYGEYGNKYSSLSIFNKYAQFGGRYSLLSPYNPRSTSPPEIISGNHRVAYLTVNTEFSPRVDPEDVFKWAEAHVKKLFS